MRRRILCLATFSLIAMPAFSVVAAPQPHPDPSKWYKLADEERIVFLGDALAEREQKYGYLETALSLKFAKKNFTFRNLGWDGDTVWCKPRAGVNAPARGYDRMLEQVRGLKPTLIILAYGGSEAYAGSDGVPAFRKQFRKLLDDLTAASARGVRLIVLAPIPGELIDDDDRPLYEYSQAMNQIAEKRGALLVGTAGIVPGSPMDKPRRFVTVDGFRLNEVGYQHVMYAVLYSMFELDDSISNILHPRPRVTELRQAIVAKDALFYSSWRGRDARYVDLFGPPKAGPVPQAEELVRQIGEADARIAELRKNIFAN